MGKPLIMRAAKVTGRLNKALDRRVPRILLENQWLADAGFSDGDDFLVTVPQLGVIVLTRRPKLTAERRRAERAEIARETWLLTRAAHRVGRAALAPLKKRRIG